MSFHSRNFRFFFFFFFFVIMPRFSRTAGVGNCRCWRFSVYYSYFFLFLARNRQCNNDLSVKNTECRFSTIFHGNGTQFLRFAGGLQNCFTSNRERLIYLSYSLRLFLTSPKLVFHPHSACNSCCIFLYQFSVTRVDFHKRQKRFEEARELGSHYIFVSWILKETHSQGSDYILLCLT